MEAKTLVVDEVYDALTPLLLRCYIDAQVAAFEKDTGVLWEIEERWDGWLKLWRIDDGLVLLQS